MRIRTILTERAIEGAIGSSSIASGKELTDRLFGLRKRAEPGKHEFDTFGPRHVPRYLAEFEYRFNRRYDLAAMIPRLTWASVRTPPMPYRLLKLAEVHA